jgi:hypothetical protein
MALAVLGAAAVLGVGSSTAEAAPRVSSFAGTYVGYAPRGAFPSWVITISDGGRITSSLAALKGSIGGRVSDDGSYSVTVSMTLPDYFDRKRGTDFIHYSYKSAGTVAPDAAGNLLGTGDRGESFLWFRQ